MKLKCLHCGGRMKLVAEGFEPQNNNKKPWIMNVMCKRCHTQMIGRGKSRADCVANYRRHCKIHEKRGKDGQ